MFRTFNADLRKSRSDEPTQPLTSRFNSRKAAFPFSRVGLHSIGNPELVGHNLHLRRGGQIGGLIGSIGLWALGSRVAYPSSLPGLRDFHRVLLFYLFEPFI